jgi:hypothetical protein
MDGELCTISALGRGFVESFDGDAVEWTEDYYAAWRMPRAEAERKAAAWKRKKIIPDHAGVVVAK